MNWKELNPANSIARHSSAYWTAEIMTPCSPWIGGNKEINSSHLPNWAVSDINDLYMNAMVSLFIPCGLGVVISLSAVGSALTFIHDETKDSGIWK